MLDSYFSFDSSAIHEEIKRGLADSSHYRTTHIQKLAIENLFTKSKTNFIFQSPAGTGKTCAFCVSMLNIICDHYFNQRSDRGISIPKGFPIGLIISPTAELCQQIGKEMSSISRHLPISVSVIASSINMEEEWSDLLFANIVIATPGIISKFLVKKKIKLHKLLCIVIDEWDKIFSDKRFMLQDITRILTKPMPNLNLIICSSATFTMDAYQALNKIVPMSWKMLKSTQKTENKKVHHFLKRIGSFEKRVIFAINLLRKVEFQQALIFCNIKDLSNDCVETLNACGFPAVFISSKMDQKERLDVVEEFREMQYRCLVTTDLVSRGLDVPNVNVVINLDMAHDPETFLHRVGRVGRFGTGGMSVTLFKRGEAKEVPVIKKATGLTLESFSFGAIPKMSLPPIKDESMLANYQRLLIEQQQNSDKDFFFEEDENEEAPQEQQSNDNSVTSNESVSNDEESLFVKRIEENGSFELFTPSYWERYKQICNECKPPFL